MQSRLSRSARKEATVGRGSTSLRFRYGSKGKTAAVASPQQTGKYTMSMVAPPPRGKTMKSTHRRTLRPMIKASNSHFCCNKSTAAALALTTICLTAAELTAGWRADTKTISRSTLTICVESLCTKMQNLSVVGVKSANFSTIFCTRPNSTKMPQGSEPRSRRAACDQ